ncbi:MAG: peptidoglycan DD-metalloendopeptidase family protein [Bacteroidia bacterium]|nr:peptidoglycan DD-metalloendopeptidase family protein [Bacteroidia bacterium]
MLLLVTSFFLLNDYTAWFTLQGDFVVEVDSARVEIDVKEPEMLYGMVIDDLHIIKDQVKKNQLLIDLFQGSYVSEKILRQINLLPRTTFDFRKISAGKKYTLVVRNDSVKTLMAFIYEPNLIDYVVFHLEDSLLIEPQQREVRVIEKNITGIIKSSLSETIEELGISHELTNKVVDIFAWQVDFQRLQRGDNFKLMYEENQVEGNPVSIGKIKGVYFQHFGSGYYAFPFDQGDGEDYFDEEGNSLRKALLKYPIEFTRISSRYSNNRFHPVAKVFRAHRGTDFAAPTGTPIRTVGDGIVEEARYKTNNGNYVKVRHNSTYTTQYLHMSKIATGIKAGTKVRQGETIGYVGSTGLATGAHLCYRFWKNGVQVDALKVELPPSQPISNESRGDFDLVVLELMRQLELISFPPYSLPIIVAGN